MFTTTAVAADPVFLAAQVFIPPMIYQSYREDKPPVDREPMTVVATGRGKTCEQALENAKVIAVERVTGLWMIAERTTNGKEYNEKITDYTGGLVKSYTVVDNQCTQVTIEAQVVPRTNRIVTGSADVKREHLDTLQAKIANEKKRAVAIAEVDNRSKAIAVQIDNIEFKTKDNATYVVIDTTMTYQEKWKHDYYDLKKQAGSFNLESFAKPIRVVLRGKNYNDEVFTTTYQLNYDEMDLFGTDREGRVTIFPNRVERIRLTFKVDSGKIMAVDKFEVNLL